MINTAAEMTGELESVDWALMLPGSQIVRDSSVNTVWKGAVMLSDNSESMAFIKVIPNRDLFVECACSILGRQLGLNIPKPLIVLPDEKAKTECGLGDNSLAFGSEDAQHPSFTKFITKENEKELWARIEKAGSALHGGVFDEWIANGDRHTDNILYSGNDYWFIDHETALPEYTATTSACNRNQILENTYCGHQEIDRRRFVKTAEKDSIPRYGELNLAVLSEKTSGNDYLDAKSIQSIVDYLNDRTIPVLTRLLKERVDLAQKEMQV